MFNSIHSFIVYFQWEFFNWEIVKISIDETCLYFIEFLWNKTLDFSSRTCIFKKTTYHIFHFLFPVTVTEAVHWIGNHFNFPAFDLWNEFSDELADDDYPESIMPYFDGARYSDAALLNFAMKNQSRTIERERERLCIHERYQWRTWRYGWKNRLQRFPEAPIFVRGERSCDMWHSRIFLTILMLQRHTIRVLWNRQILKTLYFNDYAWLTLHYKLFDNFSCLNLENKYIQMQHSTIF